MKSSILRFTTSYKTLLAILLLIVPLLIFSPSAFAQTDPNDPSSPNYKSKTKLVQKKYFLSLGSSFGRGLDQFSESFGFYSFSGTYVLGKSSLTINSDYSHPLDGDTADVRPWRFEDVELVWNAPAFKPISIRGQSINLIPRMTYRAPVSETSQYSSTYGTLVNSLIMLTNVGRFSFILTPQLNLSYHQFDTADVAGEIKNVPLALSVSATIRMLVIKNLYLTGSTFYFQGFDYDFGSQPVNGVSSNLYYQATPTLGLIAFSSWRDRVYSNNSVFDGDTSSMGLGIIKNF